MTKAILQSLKVEELKTIIRSYNLHTKIMMTKRTKSQLVDDLDKHVYFVNGDVKLKSGNITSINSVDKSIKDKKDKKEKSKPKKEEPKKEEPKKEEKVKYWTGSTGILPNFIHTDEFGMFKIMWERQGYKVINNEKAKPKKEEPKKEEPKKEEPKKEEPKIKYINDNKQKILNIYQTKSREMGSKYIALQKELFAIRQPYVKEAERKEKDKGIKITQQRINTIIKKVSKNIPEVKSFDEKVDKYGEESQEFINNFTPIKRKLIFEGLSPLTNTEIEFIYKNILN
tara:strand:+ start:76 stop:927 length:852 start_codon:yes stop_codon:yes gene_type:complete